MVPKNTKVSSVFDLAGSDRNLEYLLEGRAGFGEKSPDPSWSKVEQETERNETTPTKKKNHAARLRVHPR